MKLIEFLHDGSTVLVEVAEPAGIAAVSNRDEVVERVGRTLDSALDQVAKFADSVGAKLKGTTAESTEVTFGIKFTAKGHLFVVESSGEATLSIKLKFSHK